MKNFAIIGCGRISKKQIQSIAKNNTDMKLIAVSDIIPSRMNEAENEYSMHLNTKINLNKYSDYNEMLKKESQIDVVIISTESGLHAKIGLDALNSGINTIIEKPLALCVKDAEELIKTAKEKNVKLGVCFQNRFNQTLNLLKQSVVNQKLGRIYTGNIRVLWNRDNEYYKKAPWRGTWELDGGALMNQSIHGIDLLNYMINDEIDTVYAQIANFSRDIEAEDYGTITVKYKNGSIGVIEGTSLIYPRNYEETLLLCAEKGTVEIGGLALNKVNIWRVEDQNESDYVHIDCGDPSCVYGFGHASLFKDFVEAIKNNSEPLVSGTEGIKALKIVLAAYKSYKFKMPVKFDELEFSTLEMKDVEIKVR